MRESVKIMIMVVATFVASSILFCNKALAENQKYIQNARALIEKYKTEKEPEYLRDACFELAKIDLREERVLFTRAEIKKAALSEWLNLVQVFDNSYDPAFNPKDGGVLKVQPPKTKNGIVYPPGTDPKLIDDPVARAAYKKAIDANRKKMENYRLQVQLRQLKDKIPSETKKFISDNYIVSIKSNQDELKSTIKAILKNKNRQEEFLKLATTTGEPGTTSKK